MNRKARRFYDQDVPNVVISRDYQFVTRKLCQDDNLSPTHKDERKQDDTHTLDFEVEEIKEHEPSMAPDIRKEGTPTTQESAIECPECPAMMDEDLAEIYEEFREDLAVETDTEEVETPGESNHLFHLHGIHKDSIDTPVPRNIAEALEGSERSLWQAAIDEELRNMDLNNTWVFIDTAPGQEVVGSRWVFARKRDASGRAVQSRPIKNICLQKYIAIYIPAINIFV